MIPEWTRKTVKGALWALGAVAAVACVVVVWWDLREAELPPPTPVSYPRMPARNALDLFRSAADFLPKGIIPDPHTTDAAQLKAAERGADTRPAVAAFVKLGLLLPYYNRAVIPASWMAPSVAKFENVAKVLALQARSCEDRGDRAGMIERCLNGIEMGEVLTRGATLWNLPIQAKCEDTCRRPLQEIVGTLSAPECRTILDRMKKIDGEHVPLVDIVRQDKLYGLMQLTLAFKEPKWRDILLDPWFSDNDDDKGALPPDARATLVDCAAALSGKTASDGRNRLQLLLISKNQVYHDYTTRLDAEIAAAGHGSWPPPHPSDLIADQLTFHGAAQAPVLDAETQAQNHLLETRVTERLNELSSQHKQRK